MEEIREYLDENGFATGHLLDAWKEEDEIFYITGIEGIIGTQTIFEVDRKSRRYRDKRMSAGAVWTEWYQMA